MKVATRIVHIRMNKYRITTTVIRLFKRREMSAEVVKSIIFSRTDKTGMLAAAPEGSAGKYDGPGCSQRNY